MAITSIIISALWILVALYWIVLSLGSKPTHSKRFTIMGGWPARIIMYGIIAVLWVFPLFANHAFDPSESLRWLGVSLCICSFVFAVWARRTLGANWNNNPTEVKVGHELVTSGPYRLVRHPIYAGLIFALLGSVLATGTIRVLVVFLLAVVGMPIKALFEERIMLQQFPGAYPAYKKQTKFILPWLW